MPGHKGKLDSEELGAAISRIDITEIEGSDNLHSPEGIIARSQERAARLFGAQETLYLVNGSTSGIYAALTGVLAPGEKLLLQRNSHGAAYNGVVLGDIAVEYIYPECSEKLGIPAGIDLDELERKLEAQPDIKAVFVTSPSYYGVCLDLEKIAELVHSQNAVLIVDEAHGSHLSFSQELPKSAIQAGADVVVQSTHKTLLGFTQSAMLHINSNRVDMDKIKKMAKIYQSTSPSYLLMSSIDHTVTYFEREGIEEFAEYIKRLKTSRERISKLEGIGLLDRIDLKGRAELDITKLVFSADGLFGKELERELRSRGIELEMSDISHGVALSTFKDSEEDLKRLEWALEDISKGLVGRDNERAESAPLMEIKNHERKISPREAFYAKVEKTELRQASGKIAGETVTPYPPGIPLLVPGEVIGQDSIDYIGTLVYSGHSVLGVEDGKIDTIREEQR